MSSSSLPVATHSLAQWCQGSRSIEQAMRVCEVVGGIRLKCRATGRQWAALPGWQGLLMLRKSWHWVEGDARVVLLEDPGLAKLQFFLDQGWSQVEAAASPGLEDPQMPCRPGEALQRWYVARGMRGDSGYASFACGLRETESYRLVAFLHDEANASLKLQELAARYGVSVSHFRRLCRHAVGGTVKTELRKWRTARALLALAGGCQSITDLALSLGYASSSHLSREIKELAGVVPSRLDDITRLPGL